MVVAAASRVTRDQANGLEAHPRTGENHLAHAAPCVADESGVDEQSSSPVHDRWSALRNGRPGMV